MASILLEQPVVVVAESPDFLLLMNQGDAEALDQMAMAQIISKTDNMPSEKMLPLAQWLKWLYYLEEVSPPRRYDGRV